MLIGQIMEGSDSYAFWELLHIHFGGLHFGGLLGIGWSCVCVEPPPRVHYMIQICFWSVMEMTVQLCIVLELCKLWMWKRLFYICFSVRISVDSYEQRGQVLQG